MGTHTACMCSVHPLVQEHVRAAFAASHAPTDLANLLEAGESVHISCCNRVVE